MKKSTQANKRPRAMVLGGYGLIGSACLRALQSAQFDVVAVGRDAQMATRIAPDVEWLICDIATQTAADWAGHLVDIDVVVNASGALQDGARDTLSAIHLDTVKALITGIAESPIRLIQISAAGVSLDASTAFFTTKAQGDAAIEKSGLDWVILRPTLVLGRAAYGGTALLRAAAAVPVIGMRVLPDVPIQTVALDDLASAVVQVASGDISGQLCLDITAPDVISFGTLTNTMRRWLGLPPWRVTVPVPHQLLTLSGWIADLLGWFGWRSPLRSTALTVLQDGIAGDPTPWQNAGGLPCRPLAQTLSDMPATVQDRWFARLFLLLPVTIATLSLFWLLSGLIGLIWAQDAIEVLTSRGITSGFAAVAVITGGVLDIGLGVTILFRRHARAACLGMIALSVTYLVSGTLLTPDIWSDPLGPFVKVLPAITLAALTTVLLDDR